MEQDREVQHPAAPLAMGLVVFLLSFLAPMSPPSDIGAGTVSPWQPTPGLVILAALSGLSTIMARRLRLPLYVVAAIGWFTYTMWPATMAASLYAALAYRHRWQGALYLLSATALVSAPIMTGALSWAYGIRVVAVMLLLMVALPYVAGLWIRTRRLLIVELEDRNARLEAEQAARAAQAKAEERTRIAREMHDVVAHQVAMIVLHAGALELKATDSHVATEAALIADTGRATLNELRQVLGVLRRHSTSDVSQPFTYKVDELLAHTRAAGQPVTMTVDGSLYGLPATVELSAFRIIQEGLTNVAKHARGAATIVQLRRLPDALEIVITNGPGQAQEMPSSGLGLVGLRERVELLGGEFSALRAVGGGFKVRASLPLPTT